MKIDQLETKINKINNDIDNELLKLEKMKINLDKFITKSKLNNSYINKKDWISYRNEFGNKNPDIQYNKYIGFRIDYGIKINNIEEKEKKIIELKNKLSENEKIYNSLIENEKKYESIKIPEIEKFLDEWVIQAKSFYKEKGIKYNEKDLLEERKSKSKYITFKIGSLIGNVIECHLHFGPNGDINGWINGSKNKISFETVYAGGWNIQKLHFRFIINIIK